MAATAKVRLAALTATAQVIKSDLSYLCALQCLNTSAAPAYVQLFDAATTAAITVGTTAPAMQVLVPATTGYVAVPLPADGIEFVNGILAASTTTDGGAVGSAAGVSVYAQIQ